MSELRVKLKIYEGPLDLLLHLIKKNEVDLADIPVALITAQYLEYLSLMESLNIEVASDFLVMAATLTQIKSRLLLPSTGEDDDELEVEEELRAAILDPLLEHLRFKGFQDFKDAALALDTRPMLNRDVFIRGRVDFPEDPETSPGGESLIEASLFDLVEAFRRLAERRVEKAGLKFVVETKTIGRRIEEIQAALRLRKSMNFEEICRNDRDRLELTLSLLAILELARTGFLALYQNLERSSDFHLYLVNPEVSLEDLDELEY